MLQTKNLAAAAVAILSFGSASAQDTAYARAARRDVSVFMEQSANQFDNAPLSVGVIYRKARKKDDFLWWKGGAGFGQRTYGPGSFSQAPGYPYLAPGDTLSIPSTVRKEQRYYAFGGLEVQREFYKGIYFFAGAELRLGYGTAHVDTASTNTFYPVGGSPYSVYGTYAPAFDERRYFGEGYGSLGVRAYTRRITAAVEVGGTLHLAGVDRTAYGTGGLDAEANFRRYRVSFGYRF